MDIHKFRKKSEVDPDTWEEWLSDASPSRHSSGSQGHPGDTKKHNRDNPQVASKPAQKASKMAQSGQANQDSKPAVSIQITMPAVRMPKVHIPWRRLRPWAIGLVLLVVALFGGRALVELTKQKKQTPEVPTSVQAVVDLGYKPILPTKAEGEPTPQTAYNKEKGVYTFLDTYLDANLTVDQQALPKSFRDNPKAVQGLADSILADDSFTTTKGEVYMHTEKSSGAQRLFVYNDKMLMFIQSTKKIDTVSWVEYIQSMQ